MYKKKFLKLLVYLALEKRRTVLIFSLVSTLISLVLASQIKMSYQWTHLLPETMPVVQEYKRIDKDFSNPGNYLVVIERDIEGNNEEDNEILLEQVTEEVIESLKKETKWVKLVVGKMPEQFVLKHGLRTMEIKDLKRTVNLFSDPRLLPFLTHLNNDLEKEYVGDEENIRNNQRDVVNRMDSIEKLVLAISSAADSNSKTDVKRVIRDLTTGNPYYFSPDRQMTMVLLASTFSIDDFDQYLPMDEDLQVLLKNIEKKYPGIKIRRTGMVPIGADEMRTLGPQTMILTILALLLVLIMLRWNFGDWLTPLWGILPLLIGISWSMGFYAVTIKTLNLITAMIMLVLIGIGIDFSIHILNRFREERLKGGTLEQALTLAVVGTGRGVMMGAITTAAAFFATMISESKGTYEFGFCAGFGILFTLGAILLILPSLLVWHEQRNISRHKKIKSPNFAPLGRFTQSFVKWRWLILSFTIISLALGFWIKDQIPYEYNFLEMEPQVDSVFLQKEIIDRYKKSPEMSSVVADNIGQARKLTRAFKKKRLVGDIDSISFLIPDPKWQEKNDRLVEKLHQFLMDSEKNHSSIASKNIRTGNQKPKENSLAAQINLESLTAQLERLYQNILEMEELSYIGGQDRVVAKLERLTGGEKGGGPLAKLVEQFKIGQRVDKEHLQKFFERFQKLLAARLKEMSANRGPVTEDMLPPEILNRYKSSKGGYLVQLYPRYFIYDKEPLERFTATVSKIAPQITGIPALMLEMNTQLISDGNLTILATAAAIFLLLLLDFRRILPALLAVVPLGVGVTWMLLAAWALGVKYNMVNLIAVPIMIGIGVDDGVHVLHRYLEDRSKSLSIIFTSVGRAVMMTSFTTMIGFGNIAFYAHPGMASLGVVLLIGVGACLCSTILVMPPLMHVASRFLTERQGDRPGHC